MGTKLDQGACRISSYCCLCPSRLLSSGRIHRPVLPRWWQKWPVAAPGLTSTVNILGTHRMTRGVFPNRLSRSHCKGLSLSSSLRPGDVVLWLAGSRPQWTAKEIISIRKAKGLTQDHTTDKYVSSDQSPCSLNYPKLFLDNQGLLISICWAFLV